MNSFKTTDNFKYCTCCQQSWSSRDDFLSDPQIKLIGYQPHFKNMQEGLFLFNHLNCATTISVISDKFRDLYTGPFYTDNKLSDQLNYDDCPDFCLFKNKMHGCLQQCERAYVGEVIQIVTMWKKTEEVNKEE
jgi:hypothetical protein